MLSPISLKGNIPRGQEISYELNSKEGLLYIPIGNEEEFEESTNYYDGNKVVLELLVR